MKKLALTSLFILLVSIAWKSLRHPPSPLPHQKEVKETAQTQRVKKRSSKLQKKSQLKKVKQKKDEQKILKLTKSSPLKKEEASTRLSFDQKEFYYQDEEGNLLITDAFVDGDNIIAHGDIIVAPSKDLSKYKDKEGVLILPKPKTWPENRIPYIIDSTMKNRDEVANAVDYVSAYTNAHLIQRTNEKNYILFTDGGEHCYSQLGMIGGEQRIVLNEKCKRGEIIHEINHALGFLHEQNREDRDKYIRIIWENIDEKNWIQFKKIRNNFIDYSQFEFDYKSIMLYPSTAFSNTKGDYSIVTREGDPYETNKTVLSERDIKKINFFYPEL